MIFPSQGEQPRAFNYYSGFQMYSKLSRFADAFVKGRLQVHQQTGKVCCPGPSDHPVQLTENAASLVSAAAHRKLLLVKSEPVFIAFSDPTSDLLLPLFLNVVIVVQNGFPPTIFRSAGDRSPGLLIRRRSKSIPSYRLFPEKCA